MKPLLWVAIVLVLVGGGLYYLGMSGVFAPAPSMMEVGAAYQAVFLTNGQVYFGHLSDLSSSYPLLTDVFYLQIAQAPQPIQPGETPPTSINLVKLGGELHGPTDAMRLNRDSILFFEDLKADSRVTQAIDQFKASNQ